MDENGQAAPRGFDTIDDLDAFKQRLASELPSDVSAVMQGSAVEHGGARFRDKGSAREQASDFDVSLSSENLFDRARETFPGFSGIDRVGPLSMKQMKELGINMDKLFPPGGRDTKFMIYPSQIELYGRGQGYPLVTR